MVTVNQKSIFDDFPLLSNFGETVTKSDKKKFSNTWQYYINFFERPVFLKKRFNVQKKGVSLKVSEFTELNVFQILTENQAKMTKKSCYFFLLFCF